MEREIKFRGKRIDNGQWIVGDVVHKYWHGDDTYLETAIRYVMKGIYSYPVAVDPSTVGQYTGLQDRDGKEVYEGDLFKVGANKRVFECKFERGCFVAYLDGKHYGTIGDLHEMYIKVIGNIHEHPELLKQQQ